MRGLRSPIEDLIAKYRKSIAHFIETQGHNFNKYSESNWRYMTPVRVLDHLQLFIEYVFYYQVSMDLLSVKQHFFELTIDLKLIRKDTRYGSVFCNEMLKRVLNNCKDSLKELKHEYDAQAQIKGDESNAHRYEQGLLSIENDIKYVEEELHLLEQNLSERAKRMIPEQWNWKDWAKLVDMEDEYDSIYSYASTQREKLEPEEKLMFMRDIYVQMVDIIEMASSMLPKEEV